MNTRRGLKFYEDTEEPEDEVRFELQESTVQFNLQPPTNHQSSSSSSSAIPSVNRSRFQSRRVTRASAQPLGSTEGASAINNAQIDAFVAPTQERLRSGVASLLFLAQHSAPSQVLSATSEVPPVPRPPSSSSSSSSSSSPGSKTAAGGRTNDSIVADNAPPILAENRIIPDRRPYANYVPSQIDDQEDDDQQFGHSYDNDNVGGHAYKQNDSSTLKAFLADRPSHWGGGQRKSLPLATGNAAKKGVTSNKRRNSAPGGAGADKKACLESHHPPMKLPHGTKKLDAVSFRPLWMAAPSGHAAASSSSSRVSTARELQMDDIQEMEGDGGEHGDDGGRSRHRGNGNKQANHGDPSPSMARASYGYGGGGANASGSGGWASPPSSTKGKGGKKGSKPKAGSLKALFQRISHGIEEKETRMINLVKSVHDPHDPRNRAECWVDMLVVADEGQDWPFHVAVVCVVRVDHRKGKQGNKANGSSSSSSNSSRGVVLFGEGEHDGGNIAAAAAVDEEEDADFRPVRMDREFDRVVGVPSENNELHNIVENNHSHKHNSHYHHHHHHNNNNHNHMDSIIDAPSSSIEGLLFRAYFQADTLRKSKTKLFEKGTVIRSYDPLVTFSKDYEETRVALDNEGALESALMAMDVDGKAKLPKLICTILCEKSD